MTKEEIFQYFYTNSANLGIKAIGITMLAGLAIGILIFATYYLTYRGVAYNAKFNISLLIILLISVVIMLMISSNIVISLGMVGALSIVRFRTAIKDSRDTVFIFWAIAEGLCVGSNNFKLAMISSLFIAIVLLLTGFSLKIKTKYILIVRNNGELIDCKQLHEFLDSYVKNYKLRTVSKDAENQEFIFEVKIKDKMLVELLDALQVVKGVKTINWVSETGDSIG